VCDIEVMIREFSIERALAALREISGAGGVAPAKRRGRMPDYFHSQVFDATLSLASVLCSNTPTVPARLASFPVAFRK
jgi:hypothetical protein